MIEITIPGKPIPLQRPRVTKTHTYNPQQELMEEVHWTMKYQMPHNVFGGPMMPLKSPLRVAMTFYMQIPPSTPNRKKKLMINTPHIKRPDIDNLVKWILDCGNMSAWYDDSLIFNLSVNKIYSDQPRTVITIEQIETSVI